MGELEREGRQRNERRRGRKTIASTARLSSPISIASGRSGNSESTTLLKAAPSDGSIRMPATRLMSPTGITFGPTLAIGPAPLSESACATDEQWRQTSSLGEVGRERRVDRNDVEACDDRISRRACGANRDRLRVVVPKLGVECPGDRAERGQAGAELGIEGANVGRGGRRELAVRLTAGQGGGNQREQNNGF